MSQVEDSTSKVSYLPYRDGDLSRGSQEKSADSDSSSYYSSSSEDEADANDKPMKAFVSSTRSTGSKRSTLRLGRSKVKILEVTFMAIAIAIVVALFSLPVVSYVYASSRHQEVIAADIHAQLDLCLIIKGGGCRIELVRPYR